MANSKRRRSALPARPFVAAIIAASVGAAPITRVPAATDAVFTAAVGIEGDSNPLERYGAFRPAVLPNGRSVSDDYVSRLSATAAVRTGDGPLKFDLAGAYTKIDSFRIDSLDRSDYRIGVNLGWTPGQLYDVQLRGSQLRGTVGLADIGGFEAAQQTARTGEATFRLRPMPQWQFSFTPEWSRWDLPQPSAPDFQLDENSSSVGIDHFGRGPVVPGVLFKLSRGKYSGIANATRFRDESVQANVSYTVSNFSSFRLLAGQTRRTTRLIEPPIDPQARGVEGTTPASTGSLTYQRTLTPKTSVSIGVTRDFTQYDAGVNTTVGTGVNGDLTWNATAKFAANVGTRFTWSKIEGLQPNLAVRTRTDLVRVYYAGLNYAPSKRFAVRGHFSRSQRDSTFRYALFNRTVAGLDLVATFD